MRILLAAALLALAVLPGCQQQPQTFHVLPAYQRGLLALTGPGHGLPPDALRDGGRSTEAAPGTG